MSNEITLGSEVRIGGMSPSMPKIKGVMEFVDPEHVTEVLAANEYTAARQIQNLVDIVDTNHDDPRIQMQAMRAIDNMVERAAKVVIAMAAGPDAPPPPVIPTTATEAKPDPRQDALSTFLTTENNDDRDSTSRTSSLHFPPTGGAEEEEEEEKGQDDQET